MSYKKKEQILQKVQMKEGFFNLLKSKSILGDF